LETVRPVNNRFTASWVQWPWFPINELSGLSISILMFSMPLVRITE
jgi:hypothetical protein